MDPRITEVAYRYYDLDQTVAQIGRDLGISRPTVNRFLNDAKQAGLVHIWVDRQKYTPLINQAETTLRNSFPGRLDHVGLVHGGTGYNDQALYSLAVRCAEYLGHKLSDGRWRVVVGRGETVRQAVSLIRPMKMNNNMHILPSSGFLRSQPDDRDSNMITRQLAERFGCSYTWLPAPAYLRFGNAQALREIHPIKGVLNALARMGEVTIVIVSVAPFPSKLTEYLMDEKLITQAEVDSCCTRGAVGEILGQPFDKQGNLVRVPYMEIGLNIRGLQELVSQKNGSIVLGLAGAEESRVAAVRGAISGGLINGLISDHITVNKVCV